jgi:hypothetical protein
MDCLKIVALLWQAGKRKVLGKTVRFFAIVLFGFIPLSHQLT